MPVNDLSDNSAPGDRPGKLAMSAEVGLILLLFFLFAGWPPPAVNEAHYLAKAKHYWNPQWCAGDLFLESKDAHVVFNWTVGWSTLLLPLPAVAWLGRLVTWSLLAWSWQRLSFRVMPHRLWSALTAGLFLLLIQRCHLAGEWVVGGVEAKGFAFALVFFALESLVAGRWRRVWLLLGAATAFHALVGGWSIVAAAFVWLAGRGSRMPLKRMLPAVAAGALLALPGLLPGLALSQGCSVAEQAEASRIYVFERLSHHLAPHTLAPLKIPLPQISAGGPIYCLLLPSPMLLRHGLLLIAFAALWLATRRDRLVKPILVFAVGAILIAAVGAVLDSLSLVFPRAAAMLLRYYWFRLSDAIVPVGVALALPRLVLHLRQRSPALAGWAPVLLLLAAAVNLGVTVADGLGDLRPGADRQSLSAVPGDPAATQQIWRDWVRVCRWVAANTPSDAVFLTPYAQQTFKWYAGRAEVVSWKDVPQDAGTLLQWWKRFQRVYPPAVRSWGLAAHGRQLVPLARRYGAKYILVDRQRSRLVPALPRLYPTQLEQNDSYAVYWVPPAGDQAEP